MGTIKKIKLLVTDFIRKQDIKKEKRKIKEKCI